MSFQAKSHAHMLNQTVNTHLETQRSRFLLCFSFEQIVARLISDLKLTSTESTRQEILHIIHPASCKCLNTSP